MKTVCETTAVAKEGGSGDFNNNLCSVVATVKVKVVNTLNDNTKCMTDKVSGLGNMDNHELTIHEGHGLLGAVTTAEMTIDNCNCIVLEACYHPDKHGGNTGVIGRALRLPDKKGATATNDEDQESEEDKATEDVSEVGVVDPVFDEGAHMAHIDFDDAVLAVEVSMNVGHESSSVQAETALQNITKSIDEGDTKNSQKTSDTPEDNEDAQNARYNREERLSHKNDCG